MKKLISVLTAMIAMFTVCGASALAADEATTSTGSSGTITSIVMIVLIFAVFYFMMIRPENKRKKKAQEMRDSISVGDKIVTIGGMVGKVVHVAGDKITFETGEDRVRIEVTKWAISSNEGKGANKEASDSEETLEK